DWRCTMPMFRTRRIALGATIAISALALSTATTAHATTPPKATASTSFIPSQISLAPDYAPSSWCLNANPQGHQANLDNCDFQSAHWDVTLLSPVDSRGGAWVTLKDQYYNLCLDAEDDGGGTPNINGDHVNSWPCDGAYQQSWYFWPLGNCDYKIINGWDL